ncbi:MAG: hypothetical protein GYB68_15135, partial [Chloroflexi bacterium]|nr:hypothetical protein [Chloroflexota bacterium]
YDRTYILLHASTDDDWIGAITTSQTWRSQRWTIGYSADDAGIGDLDRRRVIVVNPSLWADPILPWFEFWYPEVIVQTLQASSPAELTTRLNALN